MTADLNALLGALEGEHSADELRAELDRLLERRTALLNDTSPLDGSSDPDADFARDVLRFAAQVASRPVLARIRPDTAASADEPRQRQAGMKHLAKTLWLADAFFRSSPFDPVNLKAAALEASAVAAGDEPRLFARIKVAERRRPNAYRLAFLQLKALEWERVLKARGRGAADRHALIQGAFRGTDWSAITKWSIPCRRELGDALVDSALRFAEKGGPTLTEIAYSLDETEAVRLDGRAYVEERARGAD